MFLSVSCEQYPKNHYPLPLLSGRVGSPVQQAFPLLLNRKVAQKPRISFSFQRPFAHKAKRQPRNLTITGLSCVLWVDGNESAVLKG
jgi:hypothetical protein